MIHPSKEGMLSLLSLSSEPCNFVVCANHTQCQEQADGSTTCVCQAKDECPDEEEAVCGSNRKTYDNECHFRADACGRNMTFQQGKCGEKASVTFTACSGTTCRNLEAILTSLFVVIVNHRFTFSETLRDSNAATCIALRVFQVVTQGGE